MIFSNYQPVSVLPVFSKLIERLVYKRLIYYINEKKLLYKCNFGFQRCNSTHLALILLLDNISKALDTGEFLIRIFIDLSTAFGTADYSILRKIHRYDIQKLSLCWFKDYLHNRKRGVTDYNSYKSNYEPIICGDPQGFILRPLLFLVHIND